MSAVIAWHQAGAVNDTASAAEHGKGLDAVLTNNAYYMLHHARNYTSAHLECNLPAMLPASSLMW